MTLTFGSATARGAKVTRYQARCQAPGSTRTATASKKAGRVVVNGLVAGKRYSCQVRAGSRAGYGAWSRTRRV